MMILVCFAVKEEAKPFVTASRGLEHVKVLITGMGRRKAEAGVRELLESQWPSAILSCGFAGGLRADLETGAVLFATDGWEELERALTLAGAKPGKFYCARSVAVTSTEKQALAKESGADAVEMESEFIGNICKGEQIPFATVRVVLDTAGQNLPLDFNKLMAPDGRMLYSKLAIALLKEPRKIGQLMRFQKQCASAAEKLAGVVLHTVQKPEWV